MKSKKLSKDLKVGDTVTLTSGKDKHKTGLVKKIDRKNLRLIVEGIYMSKKHIKKTSQSDGGIIEREAWISFSKVKK